MYMYMILKRCIFVVLFFVTLQLFAGEVVICDFAKGGKYKLVPAYIKTQLRERGVTYLKPGQGLRLWYKSATGRDTYSWAIKKVAIEGFDKLVLRYKCNKDTFLTIDLWYDGKMVNPRLVSYVKGTGKLESLTLPVRGKELKIAISISETVKQGKETTEKVREIFLKELVGANSQPEQAQKVDVGHNVIIPQPKEARFNGENIYLVKKSLETGIVTNSLPSKTVDIMLEALIGGFSKLIKVKLSRNNLHKIKNKSVIIFLDIGGKSAVAQALKVKIPKKTEAYVIKSGEHKGKQAVIVVGSDLPGLFWGIQTLLQLVVKDKQGLFIPACHIRDWPGFSYRSFGGGNNINRIKLNLQAKINVSFYPAWDRFIKGKWNNPPEQYRQAITAAMKYSLLRGGNINQWVESYDKKSKNNIICSDPMQLEAYYSTFKIGLQQGNRVITIGFDDQAREKDAFNARDGKRFGSDLKAHAYIVAEIAKRVNREYPGTIICVIPKTYQSGTGADIKGYYDAAGVPENVVIMWTGESTVTLSYSEYKLKEFVNSIEGRDFVIFDNTFTQTLGEKRSLTLFETFAAGYKQLARNKKCLGFHAMAGFGRTELRRIKAYQIADFLWNPKRYDPESSRSRAMAKVAGTQAVAPLLKYRYYMMKIATLFPIEKPVNKLSNEFIARAAISDDEFVKFQKTVANARVALSDIKNNTNNKKLIKELETLLDNTVKILLVLNKHKKAMKTVDGFEMVKFNILKDSKGGKVFKNYSYKCKRRDGVAIYGNKVSGKNVIFEFTLKKIPDANSRLIIEAQDDDKPGKTSIQISLNDNPVFAGKNPFAEQGWSTANFSIKKTFFRTGVNKLTIKNLEESDSFTSQWVMLSMLKIKF